MLVTCTLTEDAVHVEQLKLLLVDRPEDFDNPGIFANFDSLECIGGDEWHIVYNVANCFGESMKPPIVAALRKVQKKWAASGSSQWLRGPYFKASQRDPPIYSAEEVVCLNGGMFSQEEAKAHLDSINPEAVFVSRLEFLKCMSAIQAAHPDALDRKMQYCKKGKTKSKTIRDILQKAMSPKYIEYLANAARWRSVHGVVRSDMAPGTTGNEGSHFDLKKWVYNIVGQTKDRAKVILEVWLLSQFGRHFADQQVSLPASTYRADSFQHILLKNMYPSMAAGSAAIPVPKGGLGQHDLRKSKLPALTQPRPRRGSSAAVKASRRVGVPKRLVFKKLSMRPARA